MSRTFANDIWPASLTKSTSAAPESVKVGMPVAVHFDDVTPEHTLVKFKPV